MFSQSVLRVISARTPTEASLCVCVCVCFLGGVVVRFGWSCHMTVTKWMWGKRVSVEDHQPFSPLHVLQETFKKEVAVVIWTLPVVSTPVSHNSLWISLIYHIYHILYFQTHLGLLFFLENWHYHHYKRRWGGHQATCLQGIFPAWEGDGNKSKVLANELPGCGLKKKNVTHNYTRTSLTYLKSEAALN